jgi:HK97 family phage prohead protease
MITKDREYRNFTFETNEEMKLRGIPIVFEQETVLYVIDGIEYKEIIDRNALKGARIDDVVLNVDHQGKPAAKTKNGTLILDVRNNEVYMEADLTKNATGRELHEDVKNGFYDKMSFAFSVEADEYNRETHTRRITKIKRLYDVSCVTEPAYSQTSVSARSYFDAEAEKERKALENAELHERRRKRLILLSRL